MEENNVTGYHTYNNTMMQQHKDIHGIFKNFLKEIQPVRILEIGTAFGGLTWFLRNTLDELGLVESKIISYDIFDRPEFDVLRKRNIEIKIQNIFNEDYTRLGKAKEAISYIQGEGTSLVLCDGGSKITEFNLLSPFIKKGDFIMAHDYVTDYNLFLNKFKDKIWNWCEIQEKDIEDISDICNLDFYNQHNFSKVAWVCKQRT